MKLEKILTGIAITTLGFFGQTTQAQTPAVPEQEKTMLERNGFEVYKANSSIDDAKAIVFGEQHNTRQELLGKLLQAYTNKNSTLLIEHPEGGPLDSLNLENMQHVPEDTETLTYNQLQALTTVLEKDLYKYTAMEEENTIYALDIPQRTNADDVLAEQLILFTAQYHHDQGNNLHHVEKHLLTQENTNAQDTTDKIRQALQEKQQKRTRIDSARHNHIGNTFIQYVRNSEHAVAVTGRSHVTTESTISQQYGPGLTERLETHNIPYVAITEQPKDTTNNYITKFLQQYLKRHNLTNQPETYIDRFQTAYNNIKE